MSKKYFRIFFLNLPVGTLRYRQSALIMRFFTLLGDKQRVRKSQVLYSTRCHQLPLRYLRTRLFAGSQDPVTRLAEGSPQQVAQAEAGGVCHLWVHQAHLLQVSTSQCWGSGSVGPHVFGPPGSVSQRYASGSFPILIKVLSGLK